MSRSLREQLGFLALLPFLSNAGAADGLPPLRVDPALLGYPPSPSRPPVEAGPSPGTPVVKPVEPPAPATPVDTAPANPPPPAAPVAPPASTAPGKPEAGPASKGGPTQDQRPPQVGEAPAIAPTYSAHVAAGLLPKPPVYVTADRITGQTDVQTQAEGNVEVVREDTTVKSDRLIYREPDDEVEAIGNVQLKKRDDRMNGPHMTLKMEDSTGVFESPDYVVKRVPLDRAGKPVHEAVTGSGKADRLYFEGEDKYRLENATYSTCPVGSDPSWFARVADLDLDYQKERAVAHGATVVFKGMPILYAPWMSFSLNNQRASGFLAPSIGSTTQGGPEFTTPYYWNIAPNMDATIAPRVMTRRGVQLQSEFRYLEPNYRGEAGVEYLDNDRLFGKGRDAETFRHTQNFGYGFNGSLDLNRVSDDTYFKDLSTKLSNISQTNLLRQGSLGYSASWWSAGVLVQHYQTLQDPELPPVAIPYAKLPQIGVNATRADLPFNSVFTFRGEYVDFAHPTQVLGKRTTLYPQLSVPYQTAAFYLTPKIGFNSTRYTLERQAAGVPDTITRNVPIISVDSGLTFERQTDWLGHDLTQTLEPRLFYLRVPFRDQSKIPVFDTGVADFNFAQIFSENVFTGGDRIADANQLTAAVSSRLIDPDTGTELIKGAIGQRYYFSDQTVTLPGVAPRSGHIADFLAALTGRIAPKTSLDSAMQYNPREHRLERFSFGGRYEPELGKLLNVSYRYNRTVLDQPATTTLLRAVNQIDVSGQWPLMGAWSGVGRYNYSFSERRPIEIIGGLEYNADCWVLRLVTQQVATAVGRSNTSFFVQLELNGFSKIGSDPLNLLRRNVPGYGGYKNSPISPDLPDY